MTILTFEHVSVAGANNGTLPDYIGFIATGIAVVFYGSNYVPVKKFDTGDGLFFQFFLCCGIWSVGLAVNAARAFPVFHPLVMLGGAIWTVGNLFVVPIIQTIGMGLGILVWGMFNMLTGWATARFGLLGIPGQVPSNLLLNYLGVGLSACASFVFFFVRPEIDALQQQPHPQTAGVEWGGQAGRGPSFSDQDASISVYEDVFGTLDEGRGVGNSGRLYPSLNSRTGSHRREDKRPIVGEEDVDEGEAAGASQPRRPPFWLRLTPVRRRIFGIALSVMIGPMFGVGFVPTYYVQSHVAGASENGLDYVFAHFTGIFSTSLLLLLVYTVATRNRPSVNPRIVLPAVLSGMMWGIAGASWFLANQVLSESVSYPIICTAPAIVAALWSVCVFREIRGVRNLCLLCIAISVSATGSVINGLSRS